MIHSPDSLLPRILSEAARVVRPGGHVLLAFQIGSGSRDVAKGYRAMGHDVTLTRFHRRPEQLRDALAVAGFDLVAQLSREPVANERDPQGFLIAARAGVGSSGSPSGS